MNLGNRYSQHSFAQIPSVNTSRSQFDRSFTRKTTMPVDMLVPIFVDEILPGDTVNLNLRTFCRLPPQVVPLMDRLYMDYFFFFVPTRLVWDNWKKFNGEQANPSDSTDYTIPGKAIAANTATVGSIYDYMGLPCNDTATAMGAYTLPNVLPLRAYNLIYNDWFRDQNLNDSLALSKADGPDTTPFFLVARNKKHDYFTSCLPEPQKGDPVDIPIVGTFPVTLKSTLGVNQVVRKVSDHTAYNSGPLEGIVATGYLSDGTNNSLIDPNGTLEVDIGSANSITVNELREAIQIQSLLELDARGGTRYTEILMAHFNVFNGDATLQRPEYLGGGSHEINSNPVPMTSASSGSNYQAQLASFGVGMNNGNNIGFTKSFVEHGYVIGLANMRGEVTYQQGMERFWQRQTRFDFFWPKLQQLGEQAVLTGELYWQGDAAGTNDDVFGYQERYAEYRYKPSQITGQFRSTYATPLDSWHLSQEFGSVPEFNQTFLAMGTPISRNLAVNDTNARVYWDGWFDYKHARPMMAYAVPASLGRF